MKEEIILQESNSILDRCRNRAKDRKKNKIALIQPRKGGRPSLGLLYIGAYLLDNHFEVKVFEFLDELYPPNVRYNKQVWNDIVEFNPDFVGCNVMSSTVEIVKKIVARIRKETPEKVVICGGKHINTNYEDMLPVIADFCCVGESEITLVELLDALNFGGPLSEVLGIAYSCDGKILRTESRPFLPLDSIMRPAFELVDYEKYVNFRFQGIPGYFLRTGFIFGSRGCPYHCKFCTTHIRGSYRERSIDNMIDEMEWQMRKYSVQGFVILDDIFCIREDRVIEFCNKIIEREIKTKFFCHARVDRVNNKEVLRLMKNAGLLMLAVGVESGSQTILNAMDKGITVQQIESAFKIYNELGINTFAFIIVGHPDETNEDRELTRQLLKKIKPTQVPVSYYMPMPGTPSYDFDINKAKYLRGGDKFQGFSYITDNPEFSTTVDLKELKKIGDEFEGLSMVNRNKNLFKYPEFIASAIKFLVTCPGVLLEAIYLRYIAHRTYQTSFLGVTKDAIQFYKQRF